MTSLLEKKGGTAHGGLCVYKSVYTQIKLFWQYFPKNYYSGGAADGSTGGVVV